MFYIPRNLTRHAMSVSPSPRIRFAKEVTERASATLWFSVWGLGYEAWGLGFGVWGLGLMVWGLGFRV